MMSIAQAKFRLFNRSPFFGTILFNLPVEIDEKIATAGVDGEKLYVNEKFWDKLSNRQKLGVLGHEIAHLFLNHINRIGNRTDLAINPKTGETVLLWNLATDFAVNIIVRDSMGSDYLPKSHLHDEGYRDWSSEKIY